MNPSAAVDLHALFAAPRLDQQRRAFRIGAVLMEDAELESMLRDELDATARNAALAIVKLRGERGRQLALRLLEDEDDDVVLQAVLALDALQVDEDLDALRHLADSGNVNIAQAAILAIGHSRNPAAHDAACEQIGRDPWLASAAIEALGSLGDAASIPLLRSLIDDAILGSLAIDAIARIGGQEALDVLSALWLTTPRETMESHDQLTAIVKVAEAADRLLFATPRFREELGRRMGESAAHEHELLMRARIALGRHEISVATVQQYIAGAGGALQELPPPPALRHHPELASALLAAAPRWALALASEFGERIDRDVLHALLVALIEGDVPDTDVPLLIHALHTSDSLPRRAAATIVDAVASGNATARTIFRGLLAHFSGELAPELANYAKVPIAEHALVAAARPELCGRVAEEIERLPVPARAAALDELAPWPDAITALPWERWLDEMPELLPVAARLARSAPLPRLVSRFREALRSDASPDLIDAVIAAGDSAGEAILVENALRDARDVVLEALGRCRGEASATALRGIAADPNHPARAIALRALARRATTRDLPIFLDVVSDPDWLIRHACVRAFGRCLREPRAMDALLHLANDPVHLVSECAVAMLEEQT